MQFEEALQKARKISSEVKAYLMIPNNVNASYIGRDKMFEISKHMTTLDGKPIVPKPTDHYIAVQTNEAPGWDEYNSPSSGVYMCEAGLIRYLPASLLEGKKEGEVIEYCWDGRKVKLVLSQKLCPQFRMPFEKAYEHTLDMFKQLHGAGEQYRFDIDIPDSVTKISYALIKPEAMVYSLEPKEDQPNVVKKQHSHVGLTEEELKWFKGIADISTSPEDNSDHYTSNFRSKFDQLSLHTDVNIKEGTEITSLNRILNGNGVELKNIKVIVQDDLICMAAERTFKDGSYNPYDTKIRTRKISSYFLQEYTPEHGSKYIPSSFKIDSELTPRPDNNRQIKISYETAPVELKT